MSGAGRRGRKYQDNTFITDSDDEIDVHSGSFFTPHTLDREQWYDAWTEELITTYHLLKDHCDTQGYPFLETCGFSDFLDFAYQFSSKRPPPY